MSSPKVSIAIPVHEMKNWKFFLNRLLDSIESQTFRDFEIVISDDAQSEEIRRVIHEHPIVPIKYCRRKDRAPGMARNTNEAIKNCEGELIKILYLDDYFAYPDVLENMVRRFTWSDDWQICGSNTNPNPQITEDIQYGNNKLGSPSTLMFRNKFEQNLLFNETLSWLLDCDLYYRLLFKGKDRLDIMEGVHIIIGTGDHQMTHILTDEEKLAEYEYIKQKYV